MNNSILMTMIDTFQDLLDTMRCICFAVEFSCNNVFKEFPTRHSEEDNMKVAHINTEVTFLIQQINMWGIYLLPYLWHKNQRGYKGEDKHQGLIINYNILGKD
jgi:hypothetical protein